MWGTRRVVTGTDRAGQSRFVLDGRPPRTTDFAHLAGSGSSTVWATSSVPELPSDGADPTPGLGVMIAPPGGTLFLIIRIGPDSAAPRTEADRQAASAEQSKAWPGFFEHSRHARRGDSDLHATPTVDYVIVLEGELWLELDGGEERRLRPGDIVIQNGTWHGWHNREEVPATIAVIQVGATLAEGKDRES